MSRALMLLPSPAIAARETPAPVHVARGTGRIERVQPVPRVEPDREAPASVALAPIEVAPLPRRSPVAYVVGPHRAREAYGPPPPAGQLLAIA